MAAKEQQHRVARVVDVDADAADRVKLIYALQLAYLHWQHMYVVHVADLSKSRCS